MPVPPSAAAPSGPTITVSTTPIDIQPSSAAITGSARRIIGSSASRTNDPRTAIRPSYGLTGAVVAAWRECRILAA